MENLTINSFLLAPETETLGLYNDIEDAGGVRGDSGVDLRWPEDITIPSMADQDGLPTIVNLKVHMRLRSNIYGFMPWEVRPRSSIGKTTLSLANSVGTMDRGYQGNVMVAVRNHGSRPVELKRGGSLFQAVQPSLEPVAVKVINLASEEFSCASARGAGGFGSTGVEGGKN